MRVCRPLAVRDRLGRFMAIGFAVGFAAFVHARGQSAPGTLPESKVAVPSGGAFQFSNVAIDSRGLLAGTVRNDTSHDWFVAQFDIVVFDKDGKPIRPRGGPDVVVIGIGAGATKKVEGVVPGVDGKKVARIELRFNEGRSQVEPRLVLRITMPVSASGLTVENERFRFKFSVTTDELDLSLQNKGQAPLQLDWSSASFVDTEGKAHHVIHNGVKLIDREKAQVPSVVPPGASIDDQVVSVDRIQDDPPVGLHARPFFGVSAATAPALKGRSFSLLLPLVTDGKTENVFVTFLVEDVIL